MHKGEEITIDFTVEDETEKRVKRFTNAMMVAYKKKERTTEAETLQFVQEYLAKAKKEENNFGCIVLDEFMQG